MVAISSIIVFMVISVANPFTVYSTGDGYYQVRIDDAMLLIMDDESEFAITYDIFLPDVSAKTLTEHSTIHLRLHPSQQDEDIVLIHDLYLEISIIYNVPQWVSAMYDPKDIDLQSYIDLPSSYFEYFMAFDNGETVIVLEHCQDDPDGTKSIDSINSHPDGRYVASWDGLSQGSSSTGYLSPKSFGLADDLYIEFSLSASLLLQRF